MKLGSLCPAPCIAGASTFEIPSPGCSSDQLEFGHEGGRRFYSVLLCNHDLAANVDPKVALVGLSPGKTQIDAFVDAYRRTGSYAEASIAGAFSGLAPDIIAMLNGLGLSGKLVLRFPVSTLARHPDVYGTSMVACASLTSDYSSDDFDPRTNQAAMRCSTIRLIGDLCRPTFSRLSHVLILGSKAWDAAQTMKTTSGSTVIKALEASGKVVMNLPHPSGQNQEYVKLASLSAAAMPSLQSYVSTKWEEYKNKPPRPGRRKEPEGKYKAKRATVWKAVHALRNKAMSLETTK
ncbi:MAG: hypothetical protein ACK4MV_10215 [Beijerinckiaceae bacterium]